MSAREASPPGAAFAMSGVARTAVTTLSARPLAPVVSMAVCRSEGLWPAGATISASARTPPATKRRSEVFRASSRRREVSANVTVTYPTCTPAASAKPAATFSFNACITVGFAMSSSNLIASGRVMATLTTSTVTVVNVTARQVVVGFVMPAPSHWESSAALSVHISHVLLSDESVYRAILQQVTYDPRFSRAAAPEAALTRQNIGLSDTSDGMSHGPVVIGTIVVAPLSAVVVFAGAAVVVVVAPAPVVAVAPAFVVAVAAPVVAVAAPVVAVAATVVELGSAAPGAAVDAFATVSFVLLAVAGKRLAVTASKRLDPFVLLPSLVLTVATEVVFPVVATVAAAVDALPALVAAPVVAAVAAPVVAAVAAPVVAAAAAPVVAAPVVVAPSVVAPAVALGVVVARRRTLGSGAASHQAWLARASSPCMCMPHANLYPASRLIWPSPAAMGTIPSKTTSIACNPMVILESTYFREDGGAGQRRMSRSS